MRLVLAVDCGGTVFRLNLIIMPSSSSSLSKVDRRLLIGVKLRPVLFATGSIGELRSMVVQFTWFPVTVVGSAFLGRSSRRCWRMISMFSRRIFVISSVNNTSRCRGVTWEERNPVKTKSSIIFIRARYRSSWDAGILVVVDDVIEYEPFLGRSVSSSFRRLTY